MHVRPLEEWVETEVPVLRIIPHELWERGHERRVRRRLMVRGSLQGRKPKYLYNGLLACSDCGRLIRSTPQPSRADGLAAEFAGNP
jgi:hypothetical protein